MRKLTLTLTVALVVGGCSSGSEVAPTAAQADANSQRTASVAQSVHIKTGRTTKFANLPDQGALLAFQRNQQPVHRGAQTYHAVQLSEAHALNAAAPGKSIELPIPSGGTMHIDYVRHEESLDGNWSWIGKTRDGSDAVITFGENAVFGRIAQLNTEALRLTTSAGRSWLVESDPSKMLDGNLGRESDESDTLIPRGVAAAVSAKKRTAAAAVTASDEAASAANTIDVALGFTNGMVTKYGSAAIVNTRLANLVAITNQGYQNSLVAPRVRLVRTVQVGYTDSNSNELALEAVTGYTCTTSGCTVQTVPAELAPLRTARDTYGADLVSLVRPFQAPQHQGCGIAWLLGGGGFAIDNTDAPFGYSVVSDGSDQDEGDGRTYFCREETLAHELGHNMGQQHNIEDSGSPPDTGTHSYSYGYRQATTTGFYTIMSYRLANSSQFSINYFGNPSVNYADTNNPTGSATADNARSLNLSMPLVAQFRATVVPLGGKVHNDINGNGTSDLIWYNSSTSQMAYWLMNDTAITSTSVYNLSSIYSIAATGDLDGDGRTDILWRDTSNNYYSWRSRGDGTFDYGFIANVGSVWTIARMTDINGDGRDDIVWQNLGAGQMAYWLMNGSATIGTGVFTIGTQYRVVATGDFDGDGRGDIVWSNPSISVLYLWRSRGDGTFDYFQIGTYGAGWNVVDAADINGDGRADLVWESTASGLFAHWFMNGATVGATGAFSIGTTARVSTKGDLNGDGRYDLVVTNPVASSLQLRRSRGDGTYDTVSLGGYSSAWSLIR